jgi:hypothetical protein
MALTIDDVLLKIDQGDYGPDAELTLLMRIALRGRLPPDSSPPLAEFYAAQDSGWNLFVVDALAATGLTQHPRALEAVEFTRSLVTDPTDLTQCLGLLRRLSRLMLGAEPLPLYAQAAPGTYGTPTTPAAHGT